MSSEKKESRARDLEEFSAKDGTEAGTAVRRRRTRAAVNEGGSVPEEVKPAPVRRRKAVEEPETAEPAPVRRRKAVEEPETAEPAPVRRRKAVEEPETAEPAPVRRRKAAPVPTPVTEIREEVPRRERKGGIKPAAVIAGALVLVIIIGIAAYLVAYNKVAAEYAYSRQPVLVEEEEAMDTIRTNLENGNSVTTALRRGFEDYMVIYTGGKYSFIPINYDLKMHDRDGSNVKMVSNDEWEYRVNGKTVSYKGIDVSSHQGTIDWEKVAGDKVKFAMLRAVYRGYESGKIVVDSEFENNAKNATENGIAIGAYLFSQAVTEAEIDEEVDTLLAAIAPYKIKCPVVMDIELTDGGTGRADGLSVQERTDLAKHFCERVKAAGYTPMLYYNFESAMTLIDIAQLEDYQKWFATYTMDFYYPYYYSIWQYSNTGTVNGIEGDVDMDMSFEKYW